MTHTIEFMCWEKDKPLVIQLEPEATQFKLLPGEEIKVVAEAGSDFSWTIRVEDGMKAIQLFPGTKPYAIDVFKNGELIG